jgi:signal transduction histidine kinase
MSLRTRILAILSAIVLAYVAIDHYLQRRVLAPRFGELDREQAVANMERNLDLVEAASSHVESRARDLARNSTVLALLRGEPSTFEARDVLGESHDFVCVARRDGSVLAYLALDRSQPEPQPIKLREFPSGSLDPRHHMLEPRERRTRDGAVLLDESPAAFVDTNGRVLYVASEPVRDAAGTELGRVLVGRFFDERLLAQLGESLGQELRGWRLRGSDPLPLDAGLLEDATASPRPVAQPLDAERMASYAVLNDYEHQPLLLLESTVPRPIHAQGQAVLRYALFSTVSAGLILLLALLRILDRQVLKPVAHLTEHAKIVGADDRTSARLASDRADELGVLAREFDSMMDKLAESRAAVVKAAHSAGMSEIATGILHNVGNVLNSVSIGSQLVDETLRQSRIGQLEKLVDLLASRENDLDQFVTQDPRGKKLVPFLAALRTQLVTEHQTAKEELGKVLQGIAHISELVASQQTYAIRSTLKEVTDVRKVAHKALELTKSAGSLAKEIAIETRFDEVPDVALDPNKLLEILVNVVQNARQAMQGLTDREPRLVVAIGTNADGRLAISVTDNGMGIPSENLAKIFGHGFTTKKNGHGFGLHSAANAAVELGGRLYAESDGPGRGARFVLELPLDRQGAAKAA